MAKKPPKAKPRKRKSKLAPKKRVVTKPFEATGKWFPGRHTRLPSTGAFIAYKKVYVRQRSGYFAERYERRAVLCKLLIPASAKRVTQRDEYWEGKCRASRAKVLEFIYYRRDGLLVERVIKKARSCYNHKFVYTIGAVVKPTERFDPQPITCSSGIHFFMDRGAAENY